MERHNPSNPGLHSSSLQHSDIWLALHNITRHCTKAFYEKKNMWIYSTKVSYVDGPLLFKCPTLLIRNIKVSVSIVTKKTMKTTVHGIIKGVFERSTVDGTARPAEGRIPVQIGYFYSCATAKTHVFIAHYEPFTQRTHCCALDGFCLFFFATIPWLITVQRKLCYMPLVNTQLFNLIRSHLKATIKPQPQTVR
jgi:hypothetical protein